MKFKEFSKGCPKKNKHDHSVCDLLYRVNPTGTTRQDCKEKNCMTFHAAKKIEQSILSKMRVLGKLKNHCHRHDYPLRGGAAGYDRRVTFEEED